MPELVKVISVKNPWPYCMFESTKDAENRTWFCKHKGRLLIHVSKTWDDAYLNPINLFSAAQKNELPQSLIDRIVNKTLPVSCIIGEVTLAGIKMNYDSIWSVDGQFQWVLENPIYYKTPIINVKGQQGLWEFDVEPYKELITA